MVKEYIQNKWVLLLLLMSLVAVAGCAEPTNTADSGLRDATVETDHDGPDRTRESGTAQPDVTPTTTKKDGRSSSKSITTPSTVTSTTTDVSNSHSEEDAVSDSGSTQPEVRVVEGSPEEGWANKTLQRDALTTVEFLADLPQNRTKRNRTVIEAAATICDGHDRVASDVAANATNAGQEFYRESYRIEHAARTMHGLGADLDIGTIERRMQIAREYSGTAAKYAPVVGSYQRLHNASCAVKRGDPGAKEDFYIASAEFTANLALAQQGVIYKASFKTTGMASRAIGINRLARVCGYRCVGLVQSEAHWLIRGTYSGALDAVSAEAIDGNLTVDGWNKSTRREVGRYVGNNTDATLVGTELVPETKVITCVRQNLKPGELWTYGGKLSTEAIETLRVILTDHKLPEGTDFAFLTEIESVNDCISG